MEGALGARSVSVYNCCAVRSHLYDWIAGLLAAKQLMTEPLSIKHG